MPSWHIAPSRSSHCSQDGADAEQVVVVAAGTIVARPSGRRRCGEQGGEHWLLLADALLLLLLLLDGHGLKQPVKRRENCTKRSKLVQNN